MPIGQRVFQKPGMGRFEGFSSKQGGKPKSPWGRVEVWQHRFGEKPPILHVQDCGYTL